MTTSCHEMKRLAEHTKSDSLSRLLLLAFRELSLIASEMAEILDHAATDYALFPRLAAAIDINLGAEAAVLYPAVERCDSLRQWAAAGRKRTTAIRQLTSTLTQVKSKEQQSSDRSWRQQFEKLTLMLNEHVTLEESVVSQQLGDIFSEKDLQMIGAEFKKQMLSNTAAGVLHEVGSS